MFPCVPRWPLAGRPVESVTRRSASLQRIFVLGNVLRACTGQPASRTRPRFGMTLAAQSRGRVDGWSGALTSRRVLIIGGRAGATSPLTRYRGCRPVSNRAASSPAGRRVGNLPSRCAQRDAAEALLGRRLGATHPLPLHDAYRTPPCQVPRMSSERLHASPPPAHVSARDKRTAAAAAPPLTWPQDRLADCAAKVLRCQRVGGTFKVGVPGCQGCRRERVQ